MIPFSLVAGLIRLEDGTEMEVSFLELSERSVKLRLPADTGDIREISMTFFLRHEGKTQKAEPVILSVETNGEDRYQKILTLNLKNDPVYCSAVQIFTEDYLSYVEARQTLEDAELAELYLGYPAEEETNLCGWKEWKNRHFSAVDWKFLNHLPEERALWVSSPQWLERYLNLEWNAFLREYGKESGCGEDTLSKIHFNLLYVGSEVCENLLPNVEQISQLKEKCRADGLRPVLALPLLRASSISEREELLKNWTDVFNETEGCEMIVNDLGTAEIARKYLGAKGKLRLGTLMNRGAADPREQWMKNRIKEQSNLLSDPAYTEWLIQKTGIKACSSELRYSVERTCLPTSLHLPYVRTNVSGRCTLWSKCAGGDRGGTVTGRCPGYCENYLFLYPVHLPMVGRYNALYMLREELLRNPERIEEIIVRSGAERVVLDLLL